MDYHDFFKQATGLVAPYPYQQRLGNEPWPDFLEIPTGLGKTAAVILAWLYKRIVLNDPETPHRLIYCLPMRVLVEQTVAEIRKWLGHLGGDAANIPVHLLMGGEDAVGPWMLHPERNAIWIGTQDMLLSRALMRGYGMSRYQWPVHFALLHNDALWVFDEVQLMGASLRTSAQLEAFRRQLQVQGKAHTLWLSATLNKTWLKTVDFAGYLEGATTLNISDEDSRLAASRLNASKAIQPGVARLDVESKKGNSKTYLETLAQEMLAVHQPGTNTLAILNSVERAQDLTRLLQKHKPAAELILVHARFRAGERNALNCTIQQAAPAAGRIIVATQAIEAGVDLSSQTLFTELAPWSSLVQRFGRCNRYGEYAEAMIYWLDIADEASAPPYSYAEMEQARNTLRQLQNASSSGLPPVTSEQAISHVLRRKDFLDLFNTDPDLTGFDIDISLYIRDEGAPPLFVFWRDFDGDRPEESQPDRVELCPASITQIKNHLKDKNKKAFVWDSLAGMWKSVTQNNVYPGQTLLLRAQDGGYDKTLGFVAADKQAVETLRHETSNDQIYQKDPDSIKTIPILLEDHLSHVKKAAELLLSALGHLPDGIAKAIVVAALWHDVGKVHEVFQTTLNKAWPEGDPRRLQCWAKSPSRAKHERSYFRHELASMLAWLEHGEKTPTHDLIAYLIVAHHGKVRMSLRAMPDEKAPNGKRFSRGVHEGDELPPLIFEDNSLPATRLHLDIMELGESEAMGPSWTNRTQRLLAEHGPFRLTWYETLVRIADWRASNQEQQEKPSNGESNP